MSAFSGGVTAAFVAVGFLFFSRASFVQLDVAHASDLTGLTKSLADNLAVTNQLKADNQDFRRGQIETQLNRSSLKVCRLIQAQKGPKASPLLGDALETEQYLFSKLKDEYARLGGSYNEEPCDIVLLSGN